MMLSGLSGNEIYCLAQKGWAPGNIVVGNSVYSLGVIGGFTSGLRTLAGGEIANITQMISDGRHAAIKRQEDEATEEEAHGLTGVTSELKSLSGLTEFLAIGSAIRGQSYNGPFFSTACSGQELYCQLDAGYWPRHFVIGNVAYALGVTRGLMGTLRQLARPARSKSSPTCTTTPGTWPWNGSNGKPTSAGPTPSWTSPRASCRSAPASVKCSWSAPPRSTP